MIAELKRIAQGEEMDVAPTLRKLALFTTLLHERVIALESEQPSATMQSLAPTTNLDSNPLYELFDDRVAKTLIRAGYDSVASIQAASDEALNLVSGIGPATLRTIRQLTS